MTDRRPAGKYNNIVKSINTNSSAGANDPSMCLLPIAYAPPSFNAKKKVISCKNCTSSSTTHLTCMICSKRKPLNNFANTQRKNHDRARCKLCIEKRQEEDVWSDNDITDSDDDY
ncbi:hypothetical protein G6F42_015525 [Rhizopus arrhizus]|nr:hypothetical protein G6F42_015525 [Rhizopus arrhizus]